MPQYLIAAPNTETGHIFLGVYEAENEEDAVRQLKAGDYENVDIAQQIAAEDGSRYDVYEIADSKTVTARFGKIEPTG
jgi:hypothetical protein